ncbi:MAG: elongation factor P [Dehalococcoides mccartyi]|uniref:elongation factor P n=1 Tax=Dehalococcoides mccartyi TaxID=61435 RepID=UPI00006B13BE|nr:elongation factor P [Dehalococcoides mccartyi]AGG07741.1 translation elongation factor P [Dehalococcoides mccartyi BTF08]OBW63272.1 MAG: elongation factor P [Dehalococcoides mccartyi]
MATGNELKKSCIIQQENGLFQVMDIQHVKMKHTALLRLKLKDIRDGHTMEQTFQSDEKFNLVNLEYRHMQFLYNDENVYHFMDEKTFEQIALNKAILGDAVNYLLENGSVRVMTFQEDAIGVELPASVNLRIAHTEPGFKGDTAATTTKPATLETGLVVQVPLFINTEDLIRVDTRSGQYLGKATT